MAEPAATARPRRGPADRARPGPGPPARRAVLRYAVLLAVAAAIITPVVYAALGGFRDAPQLAANPVGLPDPGCGPTTPTRSRRRASGSSCATAPSSPACRRSSSCCSPRSRRSSSPAASSPAARSRTPCSRSGCCSRSTVAILPLLILVRDLGLLDNPLGPRAAGGGVRAAADDHHPAAVLPEHPEGARGRRGDRRLRPARVLLPDPAAAGEAGARHRRGARPGLQLEPVPAAAGDAVGRGQLDPAARA